MSPKTQAASSWNTCPLDIRYLIFEKLSSVEHRALCLVNQDCRALSEQFLYSEFRWTWRELFCRPCPLPRLLRTLLSRPQLATYMRIFHLGSQADTDPDSLNELLSRRERRTRPTLPVSGDELDEPIAFIRQTGVPYGDLWIEQLRQDAADAVIALLLAQLPSLQYLHIGRIFTRETTLIGMVLRSAILTPGKYRLPVFEYLREVSFLRRRDLEEAFDTNVRNTADVQPFFYLPSLQCMSLSIQNPNEWTWPATYSPLPSRLTSLELFIIREGCLGEILSVTPNIEKLRWEWFFDLGVHDRYITPTVDLDKIAAEISQVRTTLTGLTITAELSMAMIRVGGSYRPAVRTKGSLHAMANFDMLKRLQVPWAFLVGFAQDTTKRPWEITPRNVEYLTITDDLAWHNQDKVEPNWPQWEWLDCAIVDLLEVWLKDWRTRTPHLRGITLRLRWIDMDLKPWTRRVRDRLTEVGVQTGVSIELEDVDDMLSLY